MLGLIWIPTVGHSKSIPKQIFLKKDDYEEKKTEDDKLHKNTQQAEGFIPLLEGKPRLVVGGMRQCHVLSRRYTLSGAFD